MGEEHASLEKRMIRAVSVATQASISGDQKRVYVKRITHGVDLCQRAQVCILDGITFSYAK